MSSTSWKNQAPASVAAATAAIASAARSAGFAAMPWRDGLAAVAVTSFSPSLEFRVVSRRPIDVEATIITSARVDRNGPVAIFRRLRATGPLGPCLEAPVAELVDALDSK